LKSKSLTSNNKRSPTHLKMSKILSFYYSKSFLRR